MYQNKAVSAILLAGMVMFLSSCAGPEALPLKSHPATDVYDGWRLGMQAWSFHRFTFYEAVDKTASLGLDWLEAFPGQKLSKEKPDMQFHHTMPAELRQEVKQKLKDAGVILVNYGVVDLPNDEVECRKVFDFAKDMGIETIVSQPPTDAFDLLDKLCKEYRISVALHNHPKPSIYWHPDKVLAACKGRSKWIGACADTGHWMRSGVDPVKALKKLKGRIVSLHFKDLNEFGRKGDDVHDVPWGTGKGKVRQMLAELDRQNLNGVFSIEYEYNWENSLPDLRQSVKCFDKVAGKLASSPRRWQNLFSKDLSNAIYKPGSWVMEDGVLTAKGGSNIWTKGKYGDFILDMEFKLAKGGNSGVFVRTGDTAHTLPWIEVQILDSHGEKPNKHSCGGIFDCLAPSRNTVKKAGQWNHYTITCKANKVYVVLNGQQVVDMDLNLWTEAHKNPDGTENKFDIAYKDLPRVGNISLQYHGDPVWFRNIKIKRLGR